MNRKTPTCADCEGNPMNVVDLDMINTLQIAVKELGLEVEKLKQEVIQLKKDVSFDTDLEYSWELD